LQVSSAGKNYTVVSPFANDPGAMAIYLPLLMDNLTVSTGPATPGRININQAPRRILQGIPNMPADVVDTSIQQRAMVPDPDKPGRNFETWLLAEGIVTLDQMKLLTPLVCGGGDVYRAQVIGYFHGGAAASRAEVVIDATNVPARLLLWRDISHLGR